MIFKISDSVEQNSIAQKQYDLDLNTGWLSTGNSQVSAVWQSAKMLKLKGNCHQINVEAFSM